MHRVLRRAAITRGLLHWCLVRFGTLVVVAVVAAAGTASLEPAAMAGMAPAVLLAVAAMSAADELLIRREGTLLANVGWHRFTVVRGVIVVAGALESALLLVLATLA